MEIEGRRNLVASSLGEHTLAVGIGIQWIAAGESRISARFRSGQTAEYSVEKLAFLL
jgi:hypothetical protein